MNQKTIIGIVIVCVIVVAIFLLVRSRRKVTAMAAADKSYLGDSSLPRGMRNNNPGNLRITSIAWQGKVPVGQNTDGSFEQFSAYFYGVRALIKDVKGDIEDDGLNTLNALMNEFAPAGDGANNPAGYAQTVASYAGITPGQTIDGQKETLRPIIKAIAKVENGREAITDGDFNLAWQYI